MVVTETGKESQQAAEHVRTFENVLNNAYEVVHRRCVLTRGRWSASPDASSAGRRTVSVNRMDATETEAGRAAAAHSTAPAMALHTGPPRTTASGLPSAVQDRRLHAGQGRARRL